MTRGQLSRAERERRRIRNLYAAAAGLATFVVLLFGLSAFTTFVLRPNAEVARVNDKVITRATYNKLRRWSVYQQIQNQGLLGQFGQATSAEQTNQLVQQLRNVDREDTLDATVVNQLIDDEVLRQYSQRDFGIAPTKADLKAEAVEDMLPQPTPPPEPTQAVTPAPTITGTATITPTATSTPTPGPPTSTPTPTATLPPVPGAQQTAEAAYSRLIRAWSMGPSPQQNEPLCQLGCPGISEDDYLTLVIEPQVRREQVIEKLAASSVMTEVEQIHAQHILTDTEEGAKKIIEMLDKGADFTELANTQSSEQIRNQQQGLVPNGGDLGWFPNSELSGLVREFYEAAFKVETGKYSREPVKTQFGWHVIKVIERDPKRPLTQSQIDQQKNKLYDEWFQKAKQSAVIRSSVPTPTPVPTEPAIVEPTPPPVPTPTGSPAGGSGGEGSGVASDATPSVSPTVSVTSTVTLTGTTTTPTGGAVTPEAPLSAPSPTASP